jgi:hypothetical protein
MDRRGRDMPDTTVATADAARRKAEQLAAIRLRYSINTHLDDRGVAAPADVAAATGLPASEAVGLLGRKRWREGDVAVLRAVAARLGLDVAPAGGLEPPAGDGAAG